MSEERSFEKLVEGVRTGDDQAAAEIVRRYEPAIRRAIRYRLSDTRVSMRRSIPWTSANP
ncbi:MAG: hypothetical protein U0744_09490 [Gemmataceae bacterium]